MGMVVRSNIMALNANRQLGMNNSQVSKSLEKLSSGFKINRAGDDASGLAISEKMKAQIKGLETASANSQDGISLVQTAEGALTEVHSMLNRMVELATKSANGTMQDDVDRGAIQSEVDALLKEVDRIGDSTNFNGINLLDGSLSGTGTITAASVGKIEGITTTDVDATKGKYVGAVATANAIANTESVGSSVSLTVAYSEGGVQKSSTITMTLGKNSDGDMVLLGNSGKEYAIDDFSGAGVVAADLDKAFAAELKNSPLNDKFTITGDYGTAGYTFEAKTAGSGGAVITSITDTSKVTAGTVTATGQTLTVTPAADAYQKATAAPTEYKADGSVKIEDAVFSVNGKKFAYVDASTTDISGFDKDVNIVYGTGASVASNEMAALISQKTGLNVTSAGASGILSFKAGTNAVGKGGLTLQIGDSSAAFNKMTVSVEDMRSAGLGVAGLDVSSADSAGDAIQTIRDAINKVSTNRANMGALQNRLEYTINNLDVSAENLNSANSRIRDTDMAKEMMNYTKMNVLTQAAQAMLAQANQQPQSILQLLQ